LPSEVCKSAALKIAEKGGRLSQMRIWSLSRALILIGLIGAGCGSSDTPDKAKSASPTTSTVATQAVQNPEISGQPQPKLRTLKLWLGPEEMNAEIAMSNHEITNGMMFRTHMEENEGMLFIFNGPHQASFWMKNTLLPLSCAYIDLDGVILEEHDMKPKDETPITASTARVQYVLEVKQGWFERHNIKVGTQIRTERGTLAETFFRNR
jgi:uncharacterized membrane protein (UPF0127 family)